MDKTVQLILSSIQTLKTKFNHHKLNAQSALNHLAQLNPKCEQADLNLWNYFYRNGIVNYPSAKAILKKDLQHFEKFPKKQTIFKNELKTISNNQNNWFSNYGVHSGNHDLISDNISDWKIRALLNSLICDIKIGSYDEDTSSTMMKGIR